LLAGASALSLRAAEQRFPIAVESYIFQQYAQRQKKTLADVIGEVIPMARAAGFRKVELNQQFFAPELRERVLDLIRGNGLRMPSVYVGGAMHRPELADATIQRALGIADVCKPFGCKALVNNPDPKPHGERKTDQELAAEVEGLNRLGWKLASQGFQLRVHHHTPEMLENAREWRYILRNTDPKQVALCMDLDWVHQGDQDPMALLREAGNRVAELHVRNSRDKLWLESFTAGDIDYYKVAEYFRKAGLYPLIVVELAYRPHTVVKHTLAEDLRSSRIYAEEVFGSNAG
jgi:inosose dehydratase